VSKPLDLIKAPISEALDQFEHKFRLSMKSSVPLLNTITQFIVKRKGKQVRPIFVFLSAGAMGSITEQSYRAASLIELLHTATLVHDDVVDDSNERRGFFSINALWKNKIAVLVGDFLLSRGLLLAVEHKDFELLRIMSVAVREMSEGELLQIEKTRKLDITEAVYESIISKKTAALIAACCEAGARSAGANELQANAFKMFGHFTGMAFQIKDDLFDFGFGGAIGKPTGIDIRERKMTLPLIYALDRAAPSVKKQMISLIQNHNKEKQAIARLVQFIVDSGGIEYAKTRMNQLAQQAQESLNDIPPSVYKDQLIKLLRYAIERTH
jgi:octaprenyl-diphosphate synthase